MRPWTGHATCAMGKFIHPVPVCARVLRRDLFLPPTLRNGSDVTRDRMMCYDRTRKCHEAVKNRCGKARGRLENNDSREKSPRLK